MWPFKSATAARTAALERQLADLQDLVAKLDSCFSDLAGVAADREMVISLAEAVRKDLRSNADKTHESIFELALAVHEDNAEIRARVEGLEHESKDTLEHLLASGVVEDLGPNWQDAGATQLFGSVPPEVRQAAAAEEYRMQLAAEARAPKKRGRPAKKAR